MVSDPGSAVEADGIGMRGQDKMAFPALHRENHLAVGQETRRTGEIGTKAMPYGHGFLKFP